MCSNSVCNDCHDLVILFLNLSDYAFITVKGINYCYIIHETSKSDAVCYKTIVGIYEMHIREINIKNRVYKY